MQSRCQRRRRRQQRHYDRYYKFSNLVFESRTHDGNDAGTMAHGAALKDLVSVWKQEDLRLSRNETQCATCCEVEVRWARRAYKPASKDGLNVDGNALDGDVDVNCVPAMLMMKWKRLFSWLIAIRGLVVPALPTGTSWGTRWMTSSRHCSPIYTRPAK